MSNRDLVKSWLWIIKYWSVTFSLLTLITLVLTPIVSFPSYLTVFLIGIPLFIVPATYKNLVGGGCSLRFGICALVKGILAGIAFAALSLIANYALISVLQPTMIEVWLPSTRTLTITYQIWLFSAVIGGFGARIAEVKGQTSDTIYTVDSFDESAKQ